MNHEQPSQTCVGCMELGIVCRCHSGRTSICSTSGQVISGSNLHSIRTCPVTTPLNNRFDFNPNDIDETEVDLDLEPSPDELALTKREILAIMDLFVKLGVIPLANFSQAEKIPHKSREYIEAVMNVIEDAVNKGTDSNLTSQELRGQESECRVLNLILGESFSTIFDQDQIIHASPNDDLDARGIDILIRVTPAIEALLGNPALSIQVKSNQESIEKAIKKVEGKLKKKYPSYKRRDAVETCRIYCNGQHADLTIVASIITQLAALIRQRSGEVNFKKFLQLLNPQLLQIVNKVSAQGLLERDYNLLIQHIASSPHSAQHESTAINPADYLQFITSALCAPQYASDD